MDRGAWWTTVHGVAKEWGLAGKQQQLYIWYISFSCLYTVVNLLYKMF